MPVSPSRDAAFSLSGVTHVFGTVRAIDDLTLDFERGRTTILIGSSGSGKSTALRLLIGLEWPQRGEVRCDGEPLRRERILELRRRVGYVIQEGGLFPHLSVLGNLGLLPRHLGWNRLRVAERAGELVEMVHLHPDLLGRFPAELSGGQRQRVALMRALMLDPPALLLDEPLGALDPLVRHELQEELREIFRRLGKTVVMVTHDLAEAAFFGSRLVLMRSGRIVQDGSLEDFRRAPADGFVREFLAAHRNLPGAAS
ncbi:MAG: ATP-binding cassette domain-containing protein [Lautropia sp.]|nr:MAG: ATP-binding cassette domain-containing protein [Pseudomonadota bacterium]MBC6961081.1 ATP-binding cassette domain-containing protein [Lautropia sp.]MDL1908733.1 ATP-binding cassette domain-containing protein [Betaproteobacteria bacterium PRO1]RIK87936.1 MAG: ABC transporter ATP-binding protein [Burkholderiales bacterium]